MKALKDITVADLAIGSESFREAVLTLIDTVVTVKDQDGGKFASHLLRRVFWDGDNALKYDPGDEPAMKIVENEK